MAYREAAKQLRESTHTSWKSGILDDWVKHAVRMSSAIFVAAAIFEKVDAEIETLRARIAEMERLNSEKDKLIANLVEKITK